MSGNGKQDTAAHFHAFWSGPPLSVYEELSLTSIVARGQRILLYSYDSELRVPSGVELVDANEILPGNRVHEFVYPSGEKTPALHSDIFRYEVLRRFGGWYFDLDILMLAAPPPASPIYLARESDGLVNGAIMKFPANSPMIVEACEKAQSLTDDPVWGAAGPALVTRLVEQFGMQALVRPWQQAFPIKSVEVVHMFLPEYADELQERVTGADFVHLWNEIWRRIRIPKNFGPPENSFLDAMFRRFGFRFARGARLSAQAVLSWHQDYETLASLRNKEVEADPRIALATMERDKILSSTSWRLTAPLRACVDAIKRIRGSGSDTQ